jgi:hypothetical protein
MGGHPLGCEVQGLVHDRSNPKASVGIGLVLAVGKHFERHRAADLGRDQGTSVVPERRDLAARCGKAIGATSRPNFHTFDTLECPHSIISTALGTGLAKTA